ncbi:MAG TPA: phage holin family protein [Longimicrobium sp.]|nr:phage holin family protein [Longimicrobium sp.]
MADLHVTPGTVDDGRAAGRSEPALGDLFRQLAQDSATLVRQEMTLAKAELKANVRSVARDAAMVAVGGVLALVGVIVLIAFLVVAVGDALDNYWLGALIVGVLFLLVGGLLAMSNLKKLKQEEVAPTRTLETLKEDKQWLQSEIKQARRELA